MATLNFNTLVVRYGEIAAYGHLEQIEHAAGISPRQMIGIDPETRLANAICVQDGMAKQAAMAAA